MDCRRVGFDGRGRGESGLTSLGLELFEVLEGALAGTAGAIDAPLELAEVFGLAADRLTEWILVVRGPGILVVECPHLGLGCMETPLKPLAADEVVNEGASFRGGGIVVLVVLVDEEFEIGEFFGGQDEGLGVDAGFQGVH